MGIIDRIRTFLASRSRKKEYPVYGTCSICKKRVYLPFHCEYCNNFYCDTHRLPFDHQCGKIDAWKNRKK